MHEGFPNRVVSFSYYNTSAPAGSVSRLASISDHAGRTTRFTYDGQSRLTSLTQASGFAAQRSFGLRYHGSGAYLAAVNDPRGAETTFAYEPTGTFQRALGVTDRRQHAYSYAYATATVQGQQVNRTLITDPKSRVWEWNMDARQRLVETVDPRNRRDRYTWQDDVNKPSTMVEAVAAPEQRQRTWSWDPLGNQLTRTEPRKLTEPVRTHTYHHTYGRGTFAVPFDNATVFVSDLNRYVPPKGEQHATTYFYDQYGNLTDECPPDTPCLHTDYGTAGVVSLERDAQGNTVRYFDHDPNGFPRRKVDERGKTWQMRYDLPGNLTHLRDPRGAFVANPNMPLETGAATPYTAKLTYDELDRKRTERLPKRSVQGEHITARMDAGCERQRRRVQGWSRSAVDGRVHSDGPSACAALASGGALRRDGCRAGGDLV